MKNANDPSVITSPEYRKFIEDLKARVVSARISASKAVNRDVLLNQIKAGTYERAVTEKKTHNFPLAMPEYLAEHCAGMTVFPSFFRGQNFWSVAYPLMIP